MVRKRTVFAALVGLAALAWLGQVLTPPAPLQPPAGIPTSGEGALVSATVARPTDALVRVASPLLVGSVVDRRSGLPVVGAAVTTASARTATGARGEFTIEDASAEAVDLELTVKAAGYADYVQRILKGTTARLEMERNVGFSVGVVDRVSRAPLASFRAFALPHLDANVSLPRRASRKRSEQSAAEQDGGWVWFDQAEPGAYVVWVASPEHVAPLPTVFEWSSGHGELIVEVEPPARLLVTVLDAIGNPVESAHRVCIAATKSAARLDGEYGDHTLVSLESYANDYPLRQHPVLLSEGRTVGGQVQLAGPRQGEFLVVVAFGQATVRTVAVAATGAGEQTVVVSLPPCMDLAGTIGPLALLQQIHPELPEFWLDLVRPPPEEMAALVPAVLVHSVDRTQETGDLWEAPIAVDGTFRIGHLPVGKWTFYLSYRLMNAAGRAEHHKAMLGTRDYLTPRPVRETFDAAALVPMWVEVACRGRDGLLGGTFVQVFEAGAVAQADAGSTDVDGKLRLRLQPGRYAVHAFPPPKRQPVLSTLVVTEGIGELELDLSASDVVVEAIDERGARLPAGRSMRLKAPEIGWSSEVAITDEKGAATFADVPQQPGEVLLEVQAGGKWHSYGVEASRFAAATSPRIIPVALSR